MADSPPTLAGASNVPSPAQRERPCVAALQMTSGPDVDANLATAERPHSFLEATVVKP